MSMAHSLYSNREMLCRFNSQDEDTDNQRSRGIHFTVTVTWLNERVISVNEPLLMWYNFDCYATHNHLDTSFSKWSGYALWHFSKIHAMPQGTGEKMLISLTLLA